MLLNAVRANWLMLLFLVLGLGYAAYLEFYWTAERTEKECRQQIRGCRCFEMCTDQLFGACIRDEVECSFNTSTSERDF